MAQGPGMYQVTWQWAPPEFCGIPYCLSEFPDIQPKTSHRLRHTPRRIYSLFWKVGWQQRPPRHQQRNRVMKPVSLRFQPGLVGTDHTPHPFVPLKQEVVLSVPAGAMLTSEADLGKHHQGANSPAFWSRQCIGDSGMCQERKPTVELSFFKWKHLLTLQNLTCHLLSSLLFIYQLSLVLLQGDILKLPNL